MGTSAVFPGTAARRGMYESFYLRAVSARDPVSVWIRHTVHKPPGQPAQGSIWCTVFDAARGRPFQHKIAGAGVSVPPGGWIEVDQLDEGGQRATMGNGGASGECGAAQWSLRWEGQEPPLRHLQREWLYRAPLPRTKLTSPTPAARFYGELQLGEDRRIELDGWHGMVGHNWGSEHAERWIWLHGVDFEQAPEAWMDVALGRVLVAGRLTPWVANGALSLDGRRLRVGGLTARGLQVSESADGATLRLTGERGLALQVNAQVPPETAAGWRYGDPHARGRHDVVNCSIAALALTVTPPGEQARTLTSAHGGVYELGMREHDHGVPIAPFDAD